MSAKCVNVNIYSTYTHALLHIKNVYFAITTELWIIDKIIEKSCKYSAVHIFQFFLLYIYIQWHVKVWEPLVESENVNNFNKIREIIQNACYFLFSTVLSKIFYIKYVYI